MTEELTIRLNDQPVKVTVTSTPDDTVFTVHLPSTEIGVTAGVDDDGNECWLEDGIHTERADEIGWLIRQVEDKNEAR